MISAAAISEGQNPPQQPLQTEENPTQQTPAPSHHHPLFGPSAAPSSVMTQLPMPLPLPLPLYPHHHQLAPPPHPYHPLHHHHQHAAAAAAAAMIAFEHHHGRHPLSHHLTTPRSPISGRSPSPPRFLRPSLPSRPLITNHHHLHSSYNGLRSPEAGDGILDLDVQNVPRRVEKVDKEEDWREEDKREFEGTEQPISEVVNLASKRTPPYGEEAVGSGKRGGRVVNGGSVRVLGPCDALSGTAFAPRYSSSASPFYSSSSLLAVSTYSPTPSPLQSTAPSTSFPLPKQQHPILSRSFAPNEARPHQPSSVDRPPLPPASAMIAPTFTSSAIAVGPITTPSFSYDPYQPPGAGGGEQCSVKPGQSLLKRPSLAPHHQTSVPHPPPLSSSFPSQSFSTLPSTNPPASPAMAFKVPSGKEGSLKHRLLLTRPSDSVEQVPRSPTTLVTPSTSTSAVSAGTSGKRRKSSGGSRSAAPSAPDACVSPNSSSSSAPSPPDEPSKRPRDGHSGSLSTSVPSSPPYQCSIPSVTLSEDCFSKGSLIRLRGGRVVRVEELKTEDFVKSAEGSEAIRLDPSTVMAMEERPEVGTAMLTLAYGTEKQRSQVELQSTLEQPFFVVGRGWASICPERSLSRFGLSCLRLKVGHVCISLTERTNCGSRNGLVDKREPPKHAPFDATIPQETGGEESYPAAQFPSNPSPEDKGEEDPRKSREREKSSSEAKDSNAEEDGGAAKCVSSAGGSRKRRWSAPGPFGSLSGEGEGTRDSEDPRNNRTSLGAGRVRTTVES